MASPQLFTSALRTLAPAGMPAPVTGALGRLLHLEQLDAFYASVAEAPATTGFPEHVLTQFNIELQVSASDLARVPARGPVVVVANHPFGLIDGIASVALMDRVRSDVKILANPLLGAVPQMRDRLILIDPFGDEGARRTNPRSLRAAIDWLAQGGLLIVFPAGEVAHLDLRRIGIQDPLWHPTAARLIHKTAAAALPLYFSGKNSALFQVAGLVHPRLRTALLPHELWKKRGGRVEARLGHPIFTPQLDPDPLRAGAELRRRVYWLGRRSAEPARARQEEPVAPPLPTATVAGEIQSLPPGRLLVEQGPWQVWQIEQTAAPATLREIGRLREITFRAAGEGTGLAADLDSFDPHYTHLVLWNREHHRIGGAYRLCGTDSPGRKLYTRTLFSFKPAFWERLGPALELGRSFVRLEDQRSFQALYLLWRAIGEYIVRNPRYLTLFGPVSVSSHYQPASRALLARWLRREVLDPDLAPLVKPRRAFFAPKQSFRLPLLREMERVEDYLHDLEPDSKGIPVLVRQYLRMGGRIAALHVDQSFNESLDALVVVDLRRSGRRALTKYFGADRVNAILGAD
jgi:putative hemolysin